MARDRAPKSAEVLVANTWECNLRCSYCFVDHNELTSGRGRMPQDLARLVVEALDRGLGQSASICIHFYGGEPLLNLDAMEAMVARAGDYPPGRFCFSITTNGTLLTRDAIELLGAARFEIVLSIDGPPEIHDECRRTVGGVPTHHRVLEFLDAIRSQTECHVRGSSVVRSGWSLLEASRYLGSLPLDVHKAQAVRGHPGNPYELSPSEKAAYLGDLEAIGRQVIEDLEAGREPRDDRYSGSILQLLKGAQREAYCGAGETMLGITPDGAVLPCLLMPREGNVLGQIQGDPQLWVEAGRAWKEARPERAECQDCAARAMCAGGCPAMLPVCGAGECDLTRKECEISTAIFERFRDRPAMLLALAGVT